MTYRFVSSQEQSRQLAEWRDAQRYGKLRKELIKWFNENPDITPPPHIIEIMGWKRRKRKNSP